MSLEVGIVGLPNVGKSTLFSALTKVEADAGNYPFCTIEPNYGIVKLNDSRVTRLAEIINPERVVPATLKVVDIAGLVKGASKGEGLGNQFLGNIREVDALAHIIRCFDDQNITHVNGSIDPIRDIETINTELLLSDIESLENRIANLEKKERGGDKDAPKKLKLINTLIKNLNLGNLIKETEFDEDEMKYIREFQLLTNKETIYVCNTDEESITQQNSYIDLVGSYLKDKGLKKINISADIESQLSLLEISEQKEFLNTIGLEEPGLNKLIIEGYKALQLITFFTSGPKETKAWTIKKGSLAPQAAGKIHTDFEKGFIRAETISYNELNSIGNFIEAKDNGKLRSECKEYIVKDADIMNFRFNV